MAQLQSLARLALSAQGAGLSAGFLFLGLGSTVFSYLLLESGYVPKALAAWGVIASLLLLTYTSATIVFPGAAQVLQLPAFGPMFVYEVTLGVWLLARGVRTSSRPASAA